MIAFLKKLFGGGSPRPEVFNPNPLNQPTIGVDADGFIACQDAQPPFDTQVLIRLHYRLETGEARTIGLGIRTSKVNSQIRQEEWKVAQLHWPKEMPAAITHWKPL